LCSTLAGYTLARNTQIPTLLYRSFSAFDFPSSSSDLRAVIRLFREKSMRRQTFERYKHRRLRASRKEEIPICFGLSVAGVGNNRYAFLSALFDLW
jgi:hypothetical protein